jgi:hypothetical protein
MFTGRKVLQASYRYFGYLFKKNIFTRKLSSAAAAETDRLNS